MPFVPAPSTVQVEMRYTWAGQEVENVTYWSSPALWTVGRANALAAIMISKWETNVQGLLAANLSLDEIYITDLSSDSGFAVSYTTGLPLTGEAGTASLPNNCSIALAFVTAKRGRSYRGRNYLLGLVEGQVTDNAVHSAFQDAWIAFFSAVEGDAAELTMIQVICSRIHDGEERAEADVTPVINRVFKDNTVDSQRRRLPSRGR